MNNKIITLLSFLILSLVNCAVTSHSSVKVEQGTKSSWDTMLNSEEKGPIIFTKITGADWEVDRAGLINLKDPKAVKAKLSDGKEPIHIFFYLVEHPKYGKFIIDTGLADVFKKDKSEWPITGFVASAMNTDALKIQETTGNWIQKNNHTLSGVFLTHMHIDHVMGTSDLPQATPIYTGPNEATDKGILNMFVRGTTDRLLGKNPALKELAFPTRKDSEAPAVLDFFGDGSFYVISVPGHTEGSLAFLIKTAKGAELVLGDTCHTRWGWDNDVTPGDYTKDLKRNKDSLSYLQVLAKKFSRAGIHPGHQR